MEIRKRNRNESGFNGNAGFKKAKPGFCFYIVLLLLDLL